MASRQNRCFLLQAGLRSLRALLVAMLYLYCCSSASAQEKYEMTVDPAFGRVYPADRWLPLRITLGNNSDAAIDGAVVIPIAQPTVATEFHVPVMVPAHAQVSVNAYAYLPRKTLSKLEGAHSVPVATADWRDGSGARLARLQILAQPDNADDAQAGSNSGPSGYLFLVAGDRPESNARDSYITQGLAKLLSGQVSYPLKVGTSNGASLPRERVGYGAVRAVIFDSLPPDSLDACQRKALLEYLLAGGNLVLPAPLDQADPTGTWLEQYLPVNLLGRRSADRIAGASSRAAEPPLKFREFVDISEATDAGGEVVLGDSNYVHAAIKRVGLGRVVFTSFPINALDPADPRAAAIWSNLLDLNGPVHDWTSSELVQQRDAILESMIGTPAAPWSRAAVVVAGYGLLSLLVQLRFRGSRRSNGFGVLIVIAIGLSAGLFAMAAGRGKSRNDITMARLATIELGPQGGGVRQEALVFFGREDPNFSLRGQEHATLRPVVASVDNPPTLEQLPFAATTAGVRAGRIERIWQASEAVDVEQTLSATLQFVPEGARANFDNRVGQTILSPLLLMGDGGSYRLTSVPPGKSSVLLGPRNPNWDYTNVALLTGEDASLRARIVGAAHAARKDMPVAQSSGSPVIAGWLDPTLPGLSQSSVRCAPQPTSTSAKVLLTSPLAIIASPPGSIVRIPADFLALTGAAMHGTLFDPTTREWVPSVLEGNWQLGIQMPAGVGRCKPLRVFISADLDAPKHSVVFRREQCKQGELHDNPDGAICATWSHVTGNRKASIDLNTDDVDQNNCLWLRLAVERSAADAVEIQPQWKFNSLSVELEVRTDDKR